MADISTQKFTNVSGDNLIVMPDTTKANNGDVLTYNSTSGIIWKTPGGGGGTEYTAGTDLVINNDIISVNTNGSAIGNYSFVEGVSTEATAYASHAEGLQTKAHGTFSHAEGQQTSAIAIATHSEGLYTLAQGIQSHAEGLSTNASGSCSHAEGARTSAIETCTHAEGSDTIAYGSISHAEGYLTSALGYYSHSEGWCTIANNTSMHVQGKYNKTSTNAAFVIGNGTEENNVVTRSDAFVIDWNGNVSATGDMYTSAGNVVATNSIPTANQVLTYNGTNVTWADAQGGGGAGGLSPILPTTITPILENNIYKIIIPSNNEYYIATIDDTHDVEITPPTIGANEMYNVVLFVVANDFGDKQMTVAYNDYGVAPMDDESKYGRVYGHGFTQFIFFGRGFTMKTAAYQAG